MNIKEPNGLSQLRIVKLSAPLFALSLLTLLTAFPAKALDCETFQLDQQQGYIAFVNGNMIEAEKHLTQLLKSCPDRGDVSLQKGLANLELGKYAVALDDFIKGVTTSSLEAATPLANAFSRKMKQDGKLEGWLRLQLKSTDPERAIATLFILKTHGVEQEVYYSLMLETSDEDIQHKAFTILLDSMFKQQTGAYHPLDALVPRIQDDLRASGSQRPWVVMMMLMEYLKMAPYSPAKLPVNLPPVLLPAIIELVEKGEYESQLAAMHLLGKVGSQEALQAIRQILNQSGQKVEIMEAAIKTLASLRDYESAPVLRKFLRNPDLRLAAIQALGELDDRDSVPDLIAEMPKVEFGLEAGYIAKLLARWQAKQGLPALLTLTERFKDYDVDYQALAQSLAKLGGFEARTLLLKHARDPALDERVRFEALNAIGLTLREDPSLLDIFLEALASSEYLTRLAALNAMEESILPEAYIPLQRHWEREEDDMLKVQLLKVLLKYPDTKPIYWLSKALQQEDTYLRKEAAYMLKAYSDFPGAAALYVQALGDSNQEVRRTALNALPQKPLPGLTEAILSCLEEDDDNMVITAAKILFHYRNPDVERAVKKAFYTHIHDSVRQAARETLNHWGYTY